MHLFHRTRKPDPKAYDPHRPHPYIDATEAGTSGLATSSIGLQGGFSGVANVVVTDRMMRTAGCAVPGCGRAAADDIHAPADE